MYSYSKLWGFQSDLSLMRMLEVRTGEKPRANNAARHILRVPKTDHISPHLASLHWLPVDA